MNAAVRVLLADDHALVRDMLADQLGRQPDIEIVGAAENADQAVQLAVRLRPDIVLMDIDMPGLLCFDAAETIQERCPQARVVFLSAFFHDRYIDQALSVGAAGYVTKTDPPGTVVDAIRSVAAGIGYFSEEVQARIVVDTDGTRLSGELQSRASTLTSRELQVLRYIAGGMSDKEVARTMHLSAKPSTDTPTT